MDENPQLFHAGQTLCDARYEIRRFVGHGKYAQVYEALDRRMEATDGGDARVAIKVLHPQYAEDEEAKLRLAREGRLQMHGALGRHRNVVAVLETSSTPYRAQGQSRTVAVPFLVLEYIEHITLEDYLEQQGGAVRASQTLLTVITQLGNALGWIHAYGKGVVHRDLAAHNILLRCQNSDAGCELLESQPDFVQLSDFGLAFTEEEGTITHNRLDRIAANIHYASPEILFGKVPTPQDDVYSFGVLVFRLLTGDFPFPLVRLNDQESLWNYALQVQSHLVMFPDPHACPAAVQECVLKAMAKTRAERYASVREMTAESVAALEAWQAELQGDAPAVPAVAPIAAPKVDPRSSLPRKNGGTAPVQDLPSEKPVAPRGKKPRRKGGGCLRWFLGTGLLIALVILTLVVGAITKWSPFGEKAEVSPTVQLQPITETGDRSTMVATLTPEAISTSQATGVPTLALVDATPELATSATGPTTVLAQATDLDFAYVNAAEGASNVMGQSFAGDTAGLALFSETGVLQQLTWSPDATLLAYVSDAEGAPGVYVTDGLNTRRLSPSGVTEQGPTWRTDGNALVVATEADGRSYLSLVDLVTAEHAPLTGPNFNAWAPSWSPADDYLAFVSDMAGGRDLYVLSLTDMDRAPVNVSRSGDVIADAAAWAPDGKWLVYATGSGLRWASIENLEPGTPRLFTQNGQDRAPCFLNDREILFQRTSGAGTVSIYQGRLGNDTQQRVVDNATWPACRR